MMKGFFLLQGTCSLHEERCRGGSEASQGQYDTARPLKLVFSICRIGTCHPYCFIQQQNTNGETLTTIMNHTNAGSGYFTIGDAEYPVLPGFTAPRHRALQLLRPAGGALRQGPARDVPARESLEVGRVVNQSLQQPRIGVGPSPLCSGLLGAPMVSLTPWLARQPTPSRG